MEAEEPQVPNEYFFYSFVTYSILPDNDLPLPCDRD